MQQEIHCPKCGSTQVTADKKGFSGKKAVAGAILTGGIGLLAGTLGSNKIRITCLACGNQFKPGEGGKPLSETFNTDNTLEENVLALIKQRKYIQAMQYVSTTTGKNIKEATAVVKNIADNNDIPFHPQNATIMIVIVVVVIGFIIFLMAQ